MFPSVKEKDNFLKQANDAREKRQLDKKRISAALKIQTLYRGYRERKTFFLHLENHLKEKFADVNVNKLEPIKIQSTCTSNEIYDYVKSLIVYYSYKPPHKRTHNLNILLNFTSFLIVNITNADLKHSYLSLIISKEKFQKFLTQSHKFLGLCLNQFTVLNIKDSNNYKLFTNIINLFILFTESKFWKCFPVANRNPMIDKTLKELSKNYLLTLKNNHIFRKLNNVLIQNMSNYNPILKPNILNYLLSLSLNLIECSNYEDVVIVDFCTTILSIPCILKLLQDNQQSTESESQLIDLNQLKNKLVEETLVNRIYALLSNVDRIRSIHSHKDDVNLLVCFLGNLCSLSTLDFNLLKLNLEKFIYISHQVFINVSEMISPKHSASNLRGAGETNDSIKWHPIFGYLKLKSNINNSETLIKVLDQLKLLWSHRFISMLFDSKCTVAETTNKTNIKLVIRGFFDKLANKQSNLINSPEAQSVYRICSFYRQLLLILNEPRIEILSALSFEEEFLLGLWNFLRSLGPLCGLKDLVYLLESSKDFKSHPIFDVLYILSSLVLYLVTVLDENEFYVEQKILKLSDYKMFANFLNNFIYQIISRELIDQKNLDNNPFFNVFHQLLVSLYVKDCRKPFTDYPDEFWIIKDIRVRSFVDDLEKEKSTAVLILQKIPHAISTKIRIEILKNKIEKDREALGDGEFSVIRINIRRNRMIEDAYANLGNLSINLLKSSIRVTFINEYGLKEAGIDQDGVFKEFLQEVISQLLNPKFNLFKLTSDQLLYPSSCSYYVEDHLQMFEFAGRIIGKAIYESLVVDAEFAPFFLRQLTGHRNQNYSFLDDLATLDYDLYKNLNQIKHEDNVSDLELTFTHSDYHLGKLITHDLVPSGDFIKVTNENKIKYIHLMAHFKLHKQIKDQISAFNEGLKSIIKQDWLNMFSVNEIQRLISGSLHDLNLEDLKKNVQYWGGLHSNHRLVKWLWEILENDFTREERCLFLKFVTSCPKPPLLGFSSLNPPFTIRCVESEEEEGTIYDSSIKGFLKTIMNIGGNDTSRLPTSSTCFNLLKLPNYAKKSTLKEKLRYAIKSNSGFELS